MEKLKLKHQKRKNFLTFKTPFWGQLALSLGLCLSSVVYASEFAGGWHNCVLKNDGSIACWGKSSSGLPPAGNDFIQISAGVHHSCALKNDDSIVCWGDNSSGQSSSPTGNDFTQVSAGSSYNCAVKNDGSIACWGDNYYGQSTPPVGNDFTQVNSSYKHTCALKSDGSLACWGENYRGLSTPPVGNDFIQVSAGGDHSCALKNDGSIVCWEQNNLPRNTPPTGNDFTQVSSSYRHTCALKSDGSLVCWGMNHNLPPVGNDFTQVSVGWQHACALKSDGSIACWGNNSFGQSVPPIGNDNDSDNNDDNNNDTFDNNEDCKHAIYSLKEKILTIPFVELPMLDVWNGQSTGKVQLWKGTLKQKYKTTDRFRLLMKTLAPIAEDTHSTCTATYSLDTGILSIPYIDVPTVVTVAGKKLDSGEVEVFKTTMKWEPEEKVFVVQEVNIP